MPIPQYSKVRVATERFRDEGVNPCTIGWVIEIHDDKEGSEYEVEIMDNQGPHLGACCGPGE